MIEGKTRIRSFSTEDVEKVMELIDCDDMSRYTTPHKWPKSHQTLSKMLLGHDDPLKGRLKFAICESDGGDLVGCIDIFDIDLINGTAEVGLHLYSTEARGSSHGKSAIRIAEKISFNRLNLRKLVAHVFASNEAANGLFSSSNWNKEAVLSQHMLLDGRPEDVCLFSKFDR